MPNVIVYSSILCKYCYELKEFLERNDVAFVERECTFDPQFASEAAEINPKKSLPTMVANGQVIVGFDPDKVREALHI